MSGPSLRDYNFKIAYGPSDDRLHQFYIPALSRSIKYDRSAGFFSSSALAVAATGVVHLIKKNGAMRLLVGAELDDEDVDAIQKGYSLADMLREKFLPLLDNPEEMARRRLEVLAWMVANGTLQIKVVLPQSDGKPLSAKEAQDYYHPKEGLFTDKDGDQIAFSGSVNESAQGWQKNYEQFSVYKSWDASAPYLNQVRHRFERLWKGREPDWIAIHIPQAVKERLIKFRPQRPPTKDPLEVITQAEPGVTIDPHEQILFQFLRDSPYLPNGMHLGEETATVRLWPHQKLTVDKIVSSFPQRFLLCSEVGLGKTIEAGIVLRQLILSGKVQHCLILTPKSVNRQWQEELYEKMALNIPLYNGKNFLDYFRNPLPHGDGNPWTAYPIMIASSQLAKRRERQEEVLSAGPWDMVIIDEAHHARRKDFLEDRRRPNRLLELLEGRAKLPGLANRTKCLLFLTATPMQIHPLEVWDLLIALGLGGRWRASQEDYLRFFAELRKSYDRVEWDFVLKMFEDSLATGTELDPDFVHMAEEKLGPVEWEQVRNLVNSSKKSVILKQFSPEARVMLTYMVKRHTPLRRFLQRSTRKILNLYSKKGILQDTVPRRNPRPAWIAMEENERHLYNRIEEYFSDFYQKYESERKGLGFVMTVYRRRLTSSFYAVEKSLERRLAFLKGQTPPETNQGLIEEDFEQEELSLDIEEEIEEAKEVFMDEIEYVEDFLREIRKLKGDSKWEQLDKDVKEILKEQDSMVIFTQYTDTMDYIREQLRQVYGSQVACYSGRGGEIWNGYKWVPRPKEEIKNAFREGQEVKILLCTDAASEGLNLQTCGVLINYDMPWNPMRAEQRIGRIDRIGGYSVVDIRNFFYQDTVEARVYQALSNRINWFEWVIGELQPILSGVERTIQEIALTRKEQRQTKIEQAIQQLNQQYDEQVARGLKLDEYISEEVRKTGKVKPPVTLQDLGKILTQSKGLKSYWVRHPELINSWILSLDEKETTVTFDREMFDRYPETLKLLTFGDPLLNALLDRIPTITHPEEVSLPLVRYSVNTPEPLVAYYTLLENKAKPVSTIEDLQEVLSTDFEGKPASEAEAQAKYHFGTLVTKRQQQEQERLQNEHRAKLLALEEQGRRLLVQAALCDISRAHQMTLFNRSPIVADFDEETVQRIKAKEFPFAPLFRLVDTKGLKPEITDPFWLKVQGKSERELRGVEEHLKREIKELAGHLSELKNTTLERNKPELPSIQRFYENSLH